MVYLGSGLEDGVAEVAMCFDGVSEDTLVTSARGGLKHCCYLPKNQQKFIP